MSSAEVRHPVFARVYARVGEAAEVAGQAEHRQELLSNLRGRVVEVGAGNGLNFRHYPETVAEVIAVEPEPYLRSRAEEAARASAVRIEVVAGTADALPLDDDSVDAAVCSLVLCSVPSQASALAELRRVNRPRGELRFYEHVRARSRWLARFQRGTDCIWPLLAGGCHTSRDTPRAIARAGFEIEECRRFSFRPSALVAPAAPHVLGRARLA